MSDDMIERVAAAICGEASWDASSDNQKESFRGQAREAIKAMNGPTAAMINAAYEAASKGEWERLPQTIWEVMIDAALAEGLRWSRLPGQFGG